MTEPVSLPKPKRLSLIIPLTTRSRVEDDIFPHLSPSQVVEALSTPTGALRCYLDGASAAEREFVTRAAIAWRRIWEWTDELSHWHWPSEGGSAGFESPNSAPKRLPLQTNAAKTDEDEYLGGLPTQQVVLYEKRVRDIVRDLDDLEIEQLKTQVLTDHILPLSRPGTPSSLSSRELTSLFGYSKLEDLSVVVTTIVLRALPTLAKLTQLLRTWRIRLTVLRRIPNLFFVLQDAEVGLEAGWSAISKPLTRSIQADSHSVTISRPILKRSDFEVMKEVLVDKVVSPGRILDSMLDDLEGLDDTLPDGWLERMEAIEKNYGEWAAACERKIKESELSRSIVAHESPEPPLSRDIQAKYENESKSFSCESVQLPASDSGVAITSPEPGKSSGGEPTSPHSFVSSDRNVTVKIPIGDIAGNKGTATSKHTEKSDPPSPLDQGPPNSGGITAQRLALFQNYSPFNGNNPAWSDQSLPTRTMSPVKEEGEAEETRDLPPLRIRTRHSSSDDVSDKFDFPHEDTSPSGMPSSDGPEVSASPLTSRRLPCPDPEADLADMSPPSSPPVPKEADSGSPSRPFDSPMTASALGDDSAMGVDTPVDGSFVEDFDDSMSVSEVSGPSFRRESTGDQHLRQQISDIIGSIPAKIKLSAEPSTINLNPPDLQLPRLRGKRSKEPARRSTSSLSSSRTATPSLILSPARNSRPRHSRGQQGIKVYHLSRSTGEPPIKLFIRCVGEHGERVMVRVGGGWADLSEYLKEYASHHGCRPISTDGAARVEIQDAQSNVSTPTSAAGSGPAERRGSATSMTGESSPRTPLHVHIPKTRRSLGASATSESPRFWPKTPIAVLKQSSDGPSSAESKHTSPMSASRLNWVEDDSSFLGLAGPTGKRVEMSEENKAWVESVKEKVRMVSGERRMSQSDDRNGFGELGKVGATTRLFRKAAPENASQTRK